MKTLEELKEYYNSELMTDLKELEAVRLANVRKMAQMIGPTLLVGLFLVYLMRGMEDAPAFVGFLTLVVAGIMYAAIIRGYVSDFKGRIIDKIVKFIDGGLSYRPTSCISSEHYRNSKLYTRHYDVYKGDDLVSGNVGATAIEFSELHTQYITRDSKGRTQHHTIFKGLFFVGDFNKHFKGRTFVLPDRSEKLFGSISKIFQSISISRPELVKLEDPEFERLFVVYSDDQIEARYILSPSLMRRITEFKKKANRTVSMSFLNSNVYIAIRYFKNLFEPRIFQTLLDFRPIQEYFEDLQLAVGIVEDLNLNTRIWTKE